MKNSLTAIALSLTVFPMLPAPAQNAQPDANPARASLEERVKFLKDQLKLSDEQAAKVTAVLAKSQEKVKALREDTTLSAEDRRTKLREIFTASTDEMKPILTPEQQVKWKEQVERRREQMDAQEKSKAPEEKK